MAMTATVEQMPIRDLLLTVEEVAERMGDGALRYRSSQIDEFVNERERLSVLRRKRR
jgi:hypothetical protein